MRHAAQAESLPRRLLSAPARRGWRSLLVLLIAAVCWLAFDPHPPEGLSTGWDKLNHALAFAVLGAVALLAQAPAAGRWRWALAFGGMMAFGAFIEAVQTQIPGRSGEALDLLADAVGLAIGLGALGAWLRRLGTD